MGTAFISSPHFLFNRCFDFYQHNHLLSEMIVFLQIAALFYYNLSSYHLYLQQRQTGYKMPRSLPPVDRLSFAKAKKY